MQTHNALTEPSWLLSSAIWRPEEPPSKSLPTMHLKGLTPDEGVDLVRLEILRLGREIGRLEADRYAISEAQQPSDRSERHVTMFSRAEPRSDTLALRMISAAS